MSIYELIADVLTNYAVAWQRSDGAECFGIAMELFNLIEQHVEAEMAWRDAEIERLRKTLDEIAMYWNGSHSPTATLDAGRCRKSPRLRGGEAMSIDEVMAGILEYGIEQRRATINESRALRASIEAAIEQHVAEAVAMEREELLDLVDSYAKDNTDLKDAIRARAGKDVP